MKKIEFRGITIRVYPHMHIHDIGTKVVFGYEFWYFIRHSDTHGWDKPCTIEKNVYVNFWGTILSHQPLEKLFKEQNFIALTEEEIECFM